MFCTTTEHKRRNHSGGSAANSVFLLPALALALLLSLLSGCDDGTTFVPAAPDAPTSLTATWGDRIVTLSWAAPAAAESSSSDPTHYSIYRGTTPGEDIYPVAEDGTESNLSENDQLAEVELARVESTETTYIDFTAANYDVYYYRILAVNDGGVSSPSNEVLALPKDFSAQVQKVVSPSPFENEKSGHAVAIGDGFALVGNFTTGSPVVYGYDRQDDGTWSNVESLTGSEIADGSTFGAAIALDGDTVVIGSPSDVDLLDTFAIGGAVYVYERQSDGTWSETAVLRASDRQDNDHFGFSVAIDGDTLVVGAEREDGGTDDPLSNAGAAYVYRKQTDDTWFQTAILQASDAQLSDFFGYAVAVSGNYIVVGAPNEDGGTAGSIVSAGAAYVFEKQTDGTWDQTAILQSGSPETLDNFGASIAMSGDMVLIGSPGDRGVQDTLSGAGAVHILERQEEDGSWLETAVLSASDGAANENFGASIAIGTEFTVIGATSGSDFSEADTTKINAGAAYVFQQESDGTWTQLAILRPDDGQLDDQFGISLAVYGNEIVVGADLEDGGTDDPTTSAGAAYFY